MRTVLTVTILMLFSAMVLAASFTYLFIPRLNEPVPLACQTITEVKVYNDTWLQFEGINDNVTIPTSASLSMSKERLFIIDSNMSGAHDVDVCDIDLDGKLDIVVDAYQADVVVWYRQPAELSQQWERYILTNTYNNSHDVKCGDIDGDGRPDIVAGMLSNNHSDYNQGNGTIAWWKNPSDPTVISDWKKTVIDSVNKTGLGWSGRLTGLRGVSLHDLDSDSDLDIVAAVDSSTYSGYGALYWYENPSGADALDFTKWNKYKLTAALVLSPLAECQAGDIDEDGNPDLACGEKQERGNSTLLFAPDDPTDVASWIEVTLSDDMASYHADIADLDEDGHLDVVFAQYRNDSIRWYKNPGGPDARIASHWQIYLITNKTLNPYVEDVMSVQAYDIDGDGDLDIASNSPKLTRLGSSFFWLEQTGDPTVTSNWRFHLVDWAGYRTRWAHDMIITDVDDDGWGDLVGVGCIANTTLIYYNMSNQIDYPFSVSVWVNHSTEDEQDIIAIQGNWKLTITSSGALRISGLDKDDEIIGREKVGFSSFNGRWSHVVATYNGTGLPNAFALYVNGMRYDTTSIHTPFYDRMEPMDSDMVIGPWNGGMDEVRVYKGRVLGPSEIEQLYAAGRKKNSTLLNGSLVAYYSFNENSGEIIYDTVGFEDDGIRNDVKWNNDGITTSLIEDKDYEFVEKMFMLINPAYERSELSILCEQKSSSPLFRKHQIAMT